jgi:hypothetical protein
VAHRALQALVPTWRLVEHLVDLGSESAVVDGARARLAVPPLVVAAARDPQSPASSSHKDVAPLRVNLRASVRKRVPPKVDFLAALSKTIQGAAFIVEHES